MGHAFAFVLCLSCASTISLLMKSAPLGNNSTESSEGGPPPTEGRRSLAFDMDQLKQEQVAHGMFFFGPHSREVEIVANYDPTLNSIQKELLDDEIIDVEKEKKRCARYDFGLANETHPKRRRLFLGAILGDDSLEVLQAVGMEVYNMFHTVSFVEGNTVLDLDVDTLKCWASTVVEKREL